MSLMAELQQEVEYQKMLILDARKQNDLLKAENEKLRELAFEQRKLADAIHAYWADGLSQEQFDALMKVTTRVNHLFDELGIEVES